MANLLTLLIVLAAAAVAGRHLQQRWRTASATDALLMAARRVLPAKPLTWNDLERRIWRRILATLEPGVDGAIVVPQTIVAWVAPEDLALIGSGRTAMEATLGAELTKRARAKSWRLTAAPAVAVRGDAECYRGEPIVQVHFGPIPELDKGPASQDHQTTGPTAPTVLLTDPAPVGRPDRRAAAALETVPMFRYELRGPSRTHSLDHRTPGVTVGRARSNTISFEQDLVVSQRHAKLTFHGGAWRLADLASRNGTFVNGNQVQPGEDRLLHDGDVISLAPHGPKLTFARVQSLQGTRSA